MPITPGESFGRYRIDALLGQGGMGEVYRAWDTVLRRAVALKVLHDGKEGTLTTGGEKAQKALLREARAAAALSHPNIAAIYDVGEHEETHFIAMEFVEGRSLRAFVEEGSAPIEERLRWLKEIAEALAFAHRAGLVHRDIKPENVLIANEGRRAKVLDFGIARLGFAEELSASVVTAPTLKLEELKELERTVTSTAGGGIAGTPGYMPPEQLRGEALDGRSDQFAWAVLGYELLAGRKPWSNATTALELVHAVLQQTPPEVRSFAPEVPEHVSRALLRALSSDRALRFASMKEAMLALETPAPVASSATATETKKKPAVLFLLVGFAALSGVLFWRTSRLRRTSDVRLVRSVAARSDAGVLRALSVVDHPPSASCRAEAQEHYRVGLRELRGASWTSAHTAFERALRADPSCPEVALRIVMTGYFNATREEQRRNYRRAEVLRAQLRERDALLLDSYAPLVVSEPPDFAEGAVRAKALAERFSTDAELWMLAAMRGANYSERLRQAQRATELDPQYADAWEMQGHMLLALGRREEALGRFRSCLGLAPGSPDCTQDVLYELRATGRCQEGVAQARASLLRAPESSDLYFALANMLASTGASAEAVEEALEQRWMRLDTDLRALTEPAERSRLSALYGDFPGAVRSARTFADRLAGDPTRGARFAVTLLQVEGLRESGQRVAALDLAEHFARRATVWSGAYEREDYVFSTSLQEAGVFAMLRKERRITSDDWTRFLATWQPIPSNATNRRELLWLFSEALPVETAEEARSALRVAPSDEALHALSRTSVRSHGIGEAYWGRALFLAGESARAVPILRRAASACTALLHPYVHTRSQLWLARALEATGDNSGACEAYQRVLQRWGTARPPSVTAVEARSRMHALRCSVERNR